MLIKSGFETFQGMEFALFRLRPGITEAQLLARAQAAEQGFFLHRDGLLGHWLLRGADGRYADVTLARTQALAEAICQQWLSEPETQRYLALIDEGSADMSFWTRLCQAPGPQARPQKPTFRASQ